MSKYIRRESLFYDCSQKNAKKILMNRNTEKISNKSRLLLGTTWSGTSNKTKIYMIVTLVMILKSVHLQKR